MPNFFVAGKYYVESNTKTGVYVFPVDDSANLYFPYGIRVQIDTY